MNSFPGLPIQEYEKIKPEIRSGDILLCSGNSFFSNLIKKATNSIWSHVAFILRLDNINRVMVLESVESMGVRMVTLRHYIEDYNGSGQGYPGKLLIARHRDLKQENIPNLSRFATNLLGYPYNNEEIIQIATRISLGSIGLPTHSPNANSGKEFICSEYAHVCFKSVGINIDYNSLGFIAPADFARCSKVDLMSYIETKDLHARVSYADLYQSSNNMNIINNY